jgi:hypothetical protein
MWYLFLFLVFARRVTPGTAFSLRQLRHTFGMAIRQARYRLNKANATVLKLGSALAADKALKKDNRSVSFTSGFDTVIEDFEDVDDVEDVEDVESNASSEDEDIE